MLFQWHLDLPPFDLKAKGGLFYRPKGGNEEPVSEFLQQFTPEEDADNATRMG